MACVISPRGGWAYCLGEDNVLYCFNVLTGKLEHIMTVGDGDGMGFGALVKLGGIASLLLVLTINEQTGSDRIWTILVSGGSLCYLYCMYLIVYATYWDIKFLRSWGVLLHQSTVAF